MVKIPIIVVKDKQTGCEHIVGTDNHDRLIIDSNAIHYINIQCMTSTKYDDSVDGYDFIGEISDEFGKNAVVVKFVSVVEFAEIYADVIREQCEKEINIRKMFDEAFPEEQQLQDIKANSNYKILS